MKKKLLLVLGIVFAVLFAATLVLTVYLSNSTSLVSDTGIQTGQQNNIIAYDGDNDILFVGTRTGSLFAFDNATHTQLWKVKSDASQPFTCVKVHAATGLVYAGCDDNLVYTIDVATGEVKSTLDIKRRVVDIDVTLDDTTLAVVTKTNNKSNVLVYDLATGENVANNKYTYPIKGILFTQDQTDLLITDKRGQVQRINFEGKIQAESAARYEFVSLKKTADGTYFTVDKNGSYYVFNDNCEFLRSGTVNMIKGAEVIGGTMDASGNVIVGTKQGYVYVMDADDKQIYSYRQANVISVSDFAVDGNLVYITGYGDFVDYIEASKLETVAVLQSMATLIKGLMVASAILTFFMLMMYFPTTNKALSKFGRILWKHKIAYLLLIPTFVLLIMFNYTPMVIALTRAFTNWSSRNYTAADLEFVGFYNFQRMFTEGYFLIGVKNMLILMVTGFIKTFTMPLLAAWLVYSFRGDRKKYIFRFLFVLPIVVPGIVGSLLWKQIYNPGGGLDQVLVALGLENWIHVWLGEEKTAIWSIVFMGLPYIGAFPFLMYYGGLTSIENSLYESAKIDGATRSKIFWKIQLPMIMPQVKLLIVLQFIGSIQDYGGIYLLTGGGPGTATYVPGLELYYNATTFGNYGYACAMGLVMFVFIMIGTFFNNKIKAENYGS